MGELSRESYRRRRRAKVLAVAVVLAWLAVSGALSLVLPLAVAWTIAFVGGLVVGHVVATMVLRDG
jgi:hypothetical protein